MEGADISHVDGLVPLAHAVAMITMPPSGSTTLKALAWGVRLAGLYVLVGLPWCVWKAYSTTPLLPPPPDVTPQAFEIIVATVMIAVAIGSFFMFLPIFRDDFLPMARWIERGDFRMKPSEQKS